MTIKSLQKYYNKDVVVKIYNRKEMIIFTGKVNEIPEKLLKKNVVDVNPVLNNRNKMIVEFHLGKRCENENSVYE